MQLRLALDPEQKSQSTGFRVFCQSVSVAVYVLKSWLLPMTREDFMHWHGKLAVVSVLSSAGMANQPLRARELENILRRRTRSLPFAPGGCSTRGQEPSGTIRLCLSPATASPDVGAAVPLPAGTRVLDLNSAIVLPGMIDTHVHVNTGGNTLAQRALRALANAQIDLDAGFTAVLDMD